MKKRIVWIILTVLVMGIIFVFSSQSSQASEDLSDKVASVLQVEQTEAHTRASNRKLFFGLTLRKLAHICLFGALGFCMVQAMEGWKLRVPGAAVGSFLYACFDEWHQQWSGRHGRFEDALIDLIGIGIGILGALLFSFLWKRVLTRRTAGKETV